LVFLTEHYAYDYSYAVVNYNYDPPSIA